MTLLSYSGEFSREQIELFEQIYRHLLNTDVYLANRFKDEIEQYTYLTETVSDSKDLEKEIETLRSDLDDATERYDDLETENDELKGELEKVKKDLAKCIQKNSLFNENE